MIGIFDSGSGGLTFLAAMRRRYPQYAYCYYADYEHCPFGERSPEEIVELTTQGVQKLFDAGAHIVVLACNTASAWSLRILQTQVFPHKKILGVTIPGAEKVADLGLRDVVVFATQQTVNSRTYAERVRILSPEVRVREISLPGELVRSIEAQLPVTRCSSVSDFHDLTRLYVEGNWHCTSNSWKEIVHVFFDQYKKPFADIPGIVLGCTHYSYLANLLRDFFPKSSIIDPSEEAAERMSMYIARHPEIVLQENQPSLLFL